MADNKRAIEGDDESTAGAPPAKRASPEWMSSALPVKAAILAFTLAGLERLGGGSPAATFAMDRYRLYDLARRVTPVTRMVAFGWTGGNAQARALSADGDWRPSPAPYTFGVEAVYTPMDAHVYIIAWDGGILLIYNRVRGEWLVAATPPFRTKSPIAAVAINDTLHITTAHRGTNQHYIYNRTADKWSEAAPIPGPHCITHMVAIGQDVYAVDVIATSHSILKLNLTVEPAVISIPGPPDLAFVHTIAAAGGRVYVFTNIRDCIFDPLTGTWTFRPPPSVYRRIGPATAVGQYVYTLEKMFDGASRINVLDTITGSWHLGPDPPQDWTPLAVVASEWMPPFREPARPVV
ncbi:MAG: hypothetical protein M0R22_10955 [Dehalococcoidia bacterium]|nr:hypothetical protein [Dehalococcoidia bacterium]